MNSDKVYVLLDNCVWNDEDQTEIIGVYSTKELAKKSLKEYIINLKKEVDFDNLEFSKDGIDDGYIVKESDDYFSLSLNGEWNSFRTEVSIYEEELIKEKVEIADYEIQ